MIKVSNTSTKRYDVIVFDSFQFKGKTRNRPYKVGTALSSVKGGLTVYLPPGIAVSGRVLIVPEKTPLDEIDLIEAYESAADEHGV
jgi:hypothetical protein